MIVAVVAMREESAHATVDGGAYRRSDFGSDMGVSLVVLRAVGLQVKPPGPRPPKKMPSRERMRRHFFDLLGQVGVPEGAEGFHTMLFKIAGWESTMDVLALLMDLHASGKLTERSAATALRGLAGR